MSPNAPILPISDRPPVQHQASMLSGRSIVHTVCPAGI